MYSSRVVQHCTVCGDNPVNNYDVHNYNFTSQDYFTPSSDLGS